MQDHIDHSTVAEDGDGLPMVGRGDDLGNRAVNPAGEYLGIHCLGKVPGGHPGPVFGALSAHLLERNIVGQAAVVLGKPLLDIDSKLSCVCNRAGSLERSALRAAHQPTDREARQGIGKSASLLPACVSQFRIGSLTGLRSCRQRMADEQKLHACNDRGARAARRKDLQ